MILSNLVKVWVFETTSLKNSLCGLKLFLVCFRLSVKVVESNQFFDAIMDRFKIHTKA